MPAVCFFMDKNLPIMDKAEEMSLLQYAVTVTETDTQNKVELPVRNWKIENDLRHHPRKYIVPLIMFLIAGLIGMWSINIWVLLCIVIAEVLSLSLVVRRI